MVRVEVLKNYLVEILNSLQKEYKTFNVNFLPSDVDNYSLNKIPTRTKKEVDITGNRINKEVYVLSSRNQYSSNIALNIANMGFWEAFEDKIYSNNENGILPSIEGIIKIECLNCGSLTRAQTQTCEMSIQIQIEYEVREEN